MNRWYKFIPLKPTAEKISSARCYDESHFAACTDTIHGQVFIFFWGAAENIFTG